MSTAASLPRSRVRLRMLVLLLALLMPGVPVAAAGIPVAAVAGEAAEADLTEAALRPVARGAGRPVAPRRPLRARTARPRPAPSTLSAGRAAVAVPPYRPCVLRSVVLRC
ncbi:hypothetical protein ACFWHW_19590 [Streptomyces pharetrae]|uniref:hypothetical protein n=1 Tax=Streptomyces pharetrae TaxID=291370 RepID=UPI00364B5FE9